MRKRKINCATCGKLLDVADLGESVEMEKEYREKFPESAKTDIAKQIICDDCYKKIQEWRKKNNLDEFGQPKA